MKRKMALGKVQPTFIPIDVAELLFDPAVFFEKDALGGAETLSSDLLQILRDNGIKAKSDQETALMVAILPLIVKRDDAVYNYAYKAGRAEA